MSHHVAQPQIARRLSSEMCTGTDAKTCDDTCGRRAPHCGRLWLCFSPNNLLIRVLKSAVRPHLRDGCCLQTAADVNI
jgi:hypothetical protein